MKSRNKVKTFPRTMVMRKSKHCMAEQEDSTEDIQQKKQQKEGEGEKR